MKNDERRRTAALAALGEARSIISGAKAEGKALTSEQRDKVEGLMAKSREFADGVETRRKVDRLMGSKELKGDGISPGLRGAAEALSKGETKVELKLADVLGFKAVSDADDAFELATTRTEDGITPMPLDTRYIAGYFPSKDLGNALHVQDFRQTKRDIFSESGESGLGESGLTPVERDPLATTEKAELGVEIDVAPGDVKQIALMIRGIPNALLDSVDGLSAFLQAELRKQIAAAVDRHVVNALDEAGPNGSAGAGSSVETEMRFAQAEMRALGANPNLAILSPESAASIDVQPAVDLPAAYPYGLRVQESSSIDFDLMVDTALAGVLYLGGVKLEADPYSGFSKNTTDLRCEANLLFVVRNKDALMEIAPQGS